MITHFLPFHANIPHQLYIFLTNDDRTIMNIFKPRSPRTPTNIKYFAYESICLRLHIGHLKSSGINQCDYVRNTQAHGQLTHVAQGLGNLLRNADDVVSEKQKI